MDTVTHREDPMIPSEALASLAPGDYRAKSYLTDREWDDVRQALERGVAVKAIYPLVADRYRTIHSFRRAIENRYGKLTELRAQAHV